MIPKIEAPAKPTPRIATVTAEDNLTVSVTWSAGPRVGKTDALNLSPILLAAKIFRPLREDPDLFKTVHRIAGGAAVAWGNDEAIDLSAIALHNLAEETLTAPDLKKFLKDYGLTETSLAATLEYSRRQIVSFVNDQAPIPRVVCLACRYIAMKHPLAQKNEVKIQPRIATPLSANTASTTALREVRPPLQGWNEARLNYSTVQHAY
jgi:hypothetical protein